MMASTGVKRKRSSYDAAFKLKVIEFAEVNGNRAAEREFSVSEKVVRDWRKMKETLLEMPRTKRARRGKQAHYPEMERELAGWITDQRNNGYIVSLLQIRLQAKKLNSDASFKASNGWTHRFMQRHNLSLRQKTKISQKLPNDLEDKITSFHSFLLKQRKQIDFELGQIGNMDETPMSFDLPGNRTN